MLDTGRDKELEFWETTIKNEADYEKKVMSVFANENELTKLLQKIRNKENKTVIDFGSGVGNSVPYLKEFKEIHLVDRSLNMLNISKEKYHLVKNIYFYNADFKLFKNRKKVDVILAVSSIFPEKYDDFDLIIENYKKNIKKNGEIILVLGSFEFRTFIYQLYSKYLFSIKKNPLEIQKILIQKQKEENYNALGTLVSLQQVVQKQWLKEEIELRLEKYNFKKIEIKKLHVEWDKKQRKEVYLKKYPKPWYWLIQLKN